MDNQQQKVSSLHEREGDKLHSLVSPWPETGKEDFSRISGSAFQAIKSNFSALAFQRRRSGPGNVIDAQRTERSQHLIDILPAARILEHTVIRVER